MARGYPRLGPTQILASTTTTSATSAFASTTFQVRVVASAAVNFTVGDGTPTATTSSPLLPANWVEYITVTPGQKLAALGTATVNVTEVV